MYYLIVTLFQQNSISASIHYFKNVEVKSACLLFLRECETSQEVERMLEHTCKMRTGRKERVKCHSFPKTTEQGLQMWELRAFLCRLSSLSNL